MITPEQEKWINHLSDTNSVEIFPFDPESSTKFEEVKNEIQKILGIDSIVLHRGASSLGISGQKEIDVYIPMAEQEMESAVARLEKVWGKPKSMYPAERTKFLRNIRSTTIEVMVTNKDHKNWATGEKFYEYLKANPDALDGYRKLKEDCVGLSGRKYYRRKIEFINDILDKIH